MRLHSFALQLILLGATGCTALTDLNDFETATCSELRMQLVGLDGPHKNQLVEIRAISLTSSQLGLVMLQPHGDEGELDIRIPNVFKDFDGHLDFYADVNGNQIADPPAGTVGGFDHSWVIESEDLVCADQDALATNRFVHNTDFVDLTRRNLVRLDDASLRVENIKDPLEAFELRVVQIIPGGQGETQTVGVWRRPKVSAGDPRETEPAFEPRLFGVIDDGFDYVVEFWNDSNGNQAYDPPPVDEAWTRTVTGADIACMAIFPDACTPTSGATFDVETMAHADIEQIYVNVISAP